MEIQSQSGGMQLNTVLLVIFLVLKLTGNITWSWWWVLCPLWIPLAVVAVMLLLYGITRIF